MEKNHQENGEEKQAPKLEKTLNQYGMTTFKQDENQLKDTFFNLDNTYGNNIDGQGF